MTNTITHHQFGEITVSRSRRASRISLSVRPPGKIRLSYPWNVSLKEAMEFVSLKEEWLRRTVEKYRNREQELITVPYVTRMHRLVLIPADTNRIFIRLTSNEITIYYPIDLSHTEPSVQEAIKKGIEEAWKIEAKKILPGRLHRISENTNLKFRTVTIRNTISKWGSCSAKNDISLSIHLMRLPDHLIDYILIHELCHTVHKNHGPKFHALMETLTDRRHKELCKELRNYHTRW